MNKKGDKIVVFITVPNMETAEKIANFLVENFIVACVNIVPSVTSVYYWKGEVCKDSELLLVIKTKANVFETLKQEVKKLHPYEVAEIIALPILDGAKDYLDWIDDTVKTVCQ